jgi:hypothetical protein
MEHIVNSEKNPTLISERINEISIPKWGVKIESNVTDL